MENFVATLERPNLRKSEKEERIGVRTSGAVKATLMRAASISGRSLSDFMISSALEAAKLTIEKEEQLSLSHEDREMFLAALFGPPAPNAAMSDAAKKYKVTLG